MKNLPRPEGRTERRFRRVVAAATASRTSLYHTLASVCRENVRSCRSGVDNFRGNPSVPIFVCWGAKVRKKNLNHTSLEETLKEHKRARREQFVEKASNKYRRPEMSFSLAVHISRHVQDSRNAGYLVRLIGVFLSVLFLCVL